MKLVLSLFAISICILSCSKKECEGDDLFSTKDFKVKQEVCVDEARRFKITEINDGRCPIDAICIWEGQVIIICSLYNKDGGTAKLDSIIVPNDGKGPKTVSIFEEFDVLVTDVSPYPGQLNPTRQEDFIVKMSVNK